MSSNASSVATRYVRVLRRRSVRWPVTLLWLLLALAGVALLPRFVRNTHDTVATRGHTPSRAAADRIAARFGPAAGHATAKAALLLFVGTRDSADEASDAALFWRDGGVLNGSCVDAQLDTAALLGNGSLVRRVGSRARAERVWRWPAAAAQRAFVSARNASAIWPIELRANVSDAAAEQLGRRLQRALPGVLRACAGGAALQSAVLGDATFLHAIQRAVERDMAVGDGIVVPLAFALLAVMVRAARWLVLVLASLVASAAVAFGVMYGGSQLMSVMSSTVRCALCRHARAEVRAPLSAHALAAV